jgi:hypothetical protein
MKARFSYMHPVKLSDAYNLGRKER